MQFRCFNNVNRFGESGKYPVAVLGGRSDFEFRKTPISHRTRILARSRSVRLTASSAGEALHVPAAGLAAAGSPYLRECTFSFVRLRFPRRACRLTSLLSRRRGAQPCLSAASDTQSRPLSFRMQYLYARCAASHLLPLPRAASIAPLRRAGVSVCPPFASKTDPEPPRAPFSPNTYPAWGAEHPRTGARRAP